MAWKNLLFHSSNGFTSSFSSSFWGVLAISLVTIQLVINVALCCNLPMSCLRTWPLRAHISEDLVINIECWSIRFGLVENSKSCEFWVFECFWCQHTEQNKIKAGIGNVSIPDFLLVKSFKWWKYHEKNLHFTTPVLLSKVTENLKKEGWTASRFKFQKVINVNPGLALVCAIDSVRKVFDHFFLVWLRLCVALCLVRNFNKYLLAFCHFAFGL